MERQGRQDFQPPAIGMRDVDSARMQMQAIFQLAAAFGSVTTIFEIADNGRADCARCARI